MIQQEYKNNVQQTNGTIETTGFNIEVNESMFQMLTSNVYNDPKLAVMREWSTNACDACIAAGKEVKFDVHLPTLEETIFSVRDYGTGLSPEDIKGLFSNLGASTKRNSNAYNGTLGIGRMAGLAVADAFTVDSYFNGTQYSYVISMQDGVPVTMSLGTNDTTEPNGLLLCIAVDHSDINSYIDRAEKLYKFFDHKPNLNLEGLEIHLDISEHISDDWFITKSNTRSFRDSNYVVMSQVAYEIPYNREVDSQGFSNLVIKAAPGSVTFNPGRESLSLNKNTIEYLNKRFIEIAEEYLEAADDALALCETDFQLMKTYGSVTQACPRSLIKNIDPSKYASDYFKAIFSTPRYVCHPSHIPTFNDLSMTSAFKAQSEYLLTFSHKSSHYKNSKVIDRSNPLTWREFFNSSHVIVDLKSKFRSALNDNFSYQSLISWQKAKGADFDEAVEKAKEYLEGMGIPYQLASDIVTQEDIKLSSTAPREGFYASTVSRSDVHRSQKMEEEEITDRTYLYLRLKNTTPIIDDPELDFLDYATAYNLLTCVIKDLPPVKGVTKKYQHYVDDLDNWIDYETYIKEKIKEATFKIPIEGTKPSRISTRLMNRDTYSLYPKPLQDYYNEITSYFNFINTADYLCEEELVNLTKKLGANFVSYEPTQEIDLAQLEQTYPKTFPYLTGKETSYEMTHEMLSYIANLEEFYAVRSSY